MQPSEEMSRAAYAVRVGLSKGRISQLTKPGELLHSAMRPNGRIDALAADRLRAAYSDPGNAQTKMPIIPPRGDIPIEGAENDDDEDAALLRKSRGRIAEADADFKHMRNMERAQKLVDKDAFGARETDRLKALFDALRGGQLSIVDRLIFENLLPGEKQDEARLKIGQEIDKIIDDWRRGIKEPTDA